jgi:AcrR family transcriptional regulator
MRQKPVAARTAPIKSQPRGATPAKAPQSGIARRRSVAREDSTVSYLKRRAEISKAAIGVFDRLGFTGASISAVAAELGIDRASLYYYIPSKEALFDDVIGQVIERNAAIATAIQRSKVSPRRKLRDVIAALMASYTDNYPLLYIFVRENLAHVSDKRSVWSKRMRALNRTVEDALIGIIEEGYADGSFRKVGSSRVVAYGALGIIGWTHRWYKPGSEVSGEEVARVYAEIVLSGLEASS